MSELIAWDNYSDCTESDDDFSYKRQRENLLKKYTSYSDHQIPEYDIVSIINSCSCKDDFIKRKVDEILNINKNKTKDISSSGHNSGELGWKVVDKGGKFRNEKPSCHTNSHSNSFKEKSIGSTPQLEENKCQSYTTNQNESSDNYKYKNNYKTNNQKISYFKKPLNNKEERDCDNLEELLSPSHKSNQRKSANENFEVEYEKEGKNNKRFNNKIPSNNKIKKSPEEDDLYYDKYEYEDNYKNNFSNNNYHSNSKFQQQNYKFKNSVGNLNSYAANYTSENRNNQSNKYRDNKGYFKKNYEAESNAYEIRESDLNESNNQITANNNISVETSIVNATNSNNKKFNYQNKNYINNFNNLNDENSNGMRGKEKCNNNEQFYNAKNYGRINSNKGNSNKVDYFDFALGLDKSKSNYSNYNPRNKNYNKNIEKQYKENDINDLFEPAITKIDQLDGSKEEFKQENKIEESCSNNNEGIIKNPPIQEIENKQNFIESSVNILTKNERKLSYQMEVEKISLCITNINIKNQEEISNESIEKENRKSNQDMESIENFNNLTINFEKKESNKIGNSPKEENRFTNFPAKSNYILDNHPDNSDKNDTKFLNENHQNSSLPSEESDMFKQIPKNSFINAINYNNYYFGNNNPKDLKKEDFDNSNLNYSYNFGMNIPPQHFRIPNTNYKPYVPTNPVMMPFYPPQMATEFNNQNMIPNQMMGFYSPHYMIPYPFMGDTGFMMPNYQTGYPYFNQNGQFFYNFHNNSNVNNPITDVNSSANNEAKNSNTIITNQAKKQ